MKFTPQRMKFLHSIDGVNYSLDFFSFFLDRVGFQRCFPMLYEPSSEAF